MSRTIKHVAAFLTVLLIALLANLTWIQVFQAEELRAMPGNQRAILEEYSIERGPILAGSAAVAQSVPTEGNLKYQRQYLDGPAYVPATGFYSLLYGSTGLEKAENLVLSGQDDRFFVSRLQQLIAGRDPQGGGVTSTLNSAAQAAAVQGLGDWQGSVTAIDPKTGAILALVQSPSFDPNIISSSNTSEAQNYYEQLNADPQQPMLNRPLVSLNPPGSTFKVVVSAAALESGRFTPDSVLPGPAVYTLPGTSTTMKNAFDGACGPNGQVTLREALAISCNTAFAWLGVELGDDALREQSEKFGFGTSFEMPMTAAAAQYPADPDEAQTALSSIGQFDVRSSSMSMAMVAAGVANGGVTMYPELVQSINAPDLRTLETLQPRTFAQAMSPEHAAQLTDMMVGVVSSGTGSSARIPGVAVAGKTGEAEIDTGEPNISWFIAFAPVDDPQLAIAVTLERQPAGSAGGTVAAPIAKSVLEAMLGGGL